MNSHPSWLETVLGSFSPLRLQMRLSGAPEDYTDRENPDLENASTWIHEYFHFLQSLFTGFGHITWDAHRQSTSFLVTEWRKWSGKDIRRRLPLAHVATAKPELLFPMLVIDRTVRAWILTSQARHWMTNPGRTLDQLNIVTMPYPFVVNPQVTIRGTTHILQGREVMEGHAFFVEATFRELCGVPRSTIWDDPSVSALYKVALDYFIEQCGEEQYPEFPYVCDLALQTSWEPSEPSTEGEWQATSPAWRFHHLTQALRSLPDLKLGATTELAQRYEGFADALLGKCGYKPLKEIIEERLLAFRRKPELMNFEKLMEAGMKFRQAVPWCGGNPLPDEELWKDIQRNFRVPLVEIQGGLGSFGTSPDQEMHNEALMELQFQALAAQIYGDFSRAAIREGALECAFSKFGIHQGCEFQKSHRCPGRYRPEDGPPHPVVMTKEKVGGCTFEASLIGLGFSSTEIELDTSVVLPEDDELH